MNLVVEPYVKSRRAQSTEDCETWVPGTVANTLNCNDTGDVRTTTAITYSVREDATANTFSATELDRSNALSALWPSVQSHHAQMFIAEPSSVRRLTPLECERLMGWSDDHTRWTDTGKEQTDTQRYRQCGNGVATPVAQWIAEQIVAVDHQEVPPTAA
jgi:DNA (cytosine-5)-methyltransferase 1